MISFPKAKINIGLRVTAKRNDGFHDIETIFYPVGLSDALEFVVAPDRAKEDTLTVTGIYTGSDPEKNLVIRSVRKMRERYPVPLLKIHLHKAIPIAAGLGGGSSDAACMIKAINKCFNLSISESELKSLALDIGSDCPFFIDTVPSYATGRGEVLKQTGQLTGRFQVVLLNPGIRISTREAFNNCTPARPEKSLEKLISFHPTEWRKYIINDFEEYAIKLYPVIGEIKSSLYNAGALYSSMSGSGSTVYGIYDGKPQIPEKFRQFVIFEGSL